MKTHQGKIVNYLYEETINSSYLDGTFHGGYTTMKFRNLTPSVEGKDLVYDVMLKELANHKQELKNDKEVTVHIEWDITDDYSKYIAVRVLRVEINEKESV